MYIVADREIIFPQGLIQFSSRYHTAANSSGTANLTHSNSKSNRNNTNSSSNNEISLSVLRLQDNHISDKGALCLGQLLNSKDRQANLTFSAGGKQQQHLHPHQVRAAQPNQQLR